MFYIRKSLFSRELFNVVKIWEDLRNVKFTNQLNNFREKLGSSGKFLR